VDENREKLIKLLTERHIFYKETFDTESGQKVIEDLEKDYYVNNSLINTTNVIDPYVIAFREGQRSVILRINNLRSDKQIKAIGGESDNGTVAHHQV
jgi:hypothetical protein